MSEKYSYVTMKRDKGMVLVFGIWTIRSPKVLKIYLSSRVLFRSDSVLYIMFIFIPVGPILPPPQESEVK